MHDNSSRYFTHESVNSSSIFDDYAPFLQVAKYLESKRHIYENIEYSNNENMHINELFRRLNMSS